MPRTRKLQGKKLTSLSGLESFRTRGLFGHMSDMYSFPDTIEDTIDWQTVYTGGGGFAQDARNIRGYFHKVFQKLEPEE